MNTLEAGASLPLSATYLVFRQSMVYVSGFLAVHGVRIWFSGSPWCTYLVFWQSMVYVSLDRLTARIFNPGTGCSGHVDD